MLTGNACNYFIFILIFLFPLLISKDILWNGIDPGAENKIVNETSFLFRYIEKVSSENLTLTCARPPGAFVFWKFPNSKPNRANFSSDELRSRIRFQHDLLQSKLHIHSLKTTDTGEYSCEVQGKPLRDTIFLFVRGEKVFLPNKNSPLSVNLKDFYVPCETSSPISRNKLKLFIDDKEWKEACMVGNRLLSPDELRQMRETQNLSKGNDLNCSKVSENFHAGHGFFITSSKMPFKWSQINNKRLRCEYEDEFVSFLAQATQSISGFTGGKAALNCTLSNREILFLDVQRGRLKLSCPLCDPNADQSIIDRVFKRFDDNDTLREAISFWQHSQKNISKFCECIDQIGDGKSCKFLSNSSISPEQLPVFAELKLSQSTIVTPLLFLLSSLAVLIFCIFFILQKAQRSETSHSSDREMKEMTPLQMEILMEAAVDFHEDIQIVKIEQTYEERSIGVGEFGKVCELIDHNPPAVKKCLRKKSQTDSQTSLMRFKQEFMILRALNHPNVVHLLHMETIEGSNDFGIVMEYCQRGNLGNIMCNPRIIYSMKTVIVWSEELFDAVDYMFREHKVIHRDIKPENIFVTMDFVLKIGDFGLAKFIEKTCVGSFAGTHRYMSPTRSKEGDDLQASHRNDVYALGLVLWEIVERRMVFWEYGSRGSFNPYNFLADIIQKKLKRLSTPNCQREIRELIKRCTNFDRSSRPMAVEVLEEIRRIEQSDSFISSLLLKPLEKNEQQKVLRPIGFDGTNNEIPIDGSEENSCTSFDLVPHSVYLSVL